MENNKVNFSPSQLKAMSEDHISALFHSSNWEDLDSETRLSLCQEVENRLAAADNVQARTVIAEEMDGASYGYQQGNVIAVNAHMINDGVFVTTFTDENGNTVTTRHDVQAPNWNTYDTVVHEHTHGVSEDKETAPYTYIQSNSDYDLYRIQTEEKNAYDAGNKATIEAIARAEAAVGKEDSQKAAYMESISCDSYEESLENAKLQYNDPVIDKTLAQFISDRDNGIKREDPSPSYKSIESLYDKQIENNLQSLLNSKEDAEQINTQNTLAEESAPAKNSVETEEPTAFTANLDESITAETGEENSFTANLDEGITADTGAQNDGGIDGADGGIDGADGGVDTD